MPREDSIVDHYAALEISVTATSEDIKKQFRKLALKYHPDRNPGREAEFNAKFQQIQAAHELLTDPTRRKVYDRTRLYHNGGVNKLKTQQRHESTAPTAEQPPTRKYGHGAGRASFATSPRAGDGPFSTKHQWDHASRPYNHAGSAWKTTQDRWQQQPTREVPRTPKKTRDNPYVSPDIDPISPEDPTYTFHRDNVANGNPPSKHSFFGDRNPREKEWMAPTSESKSSGTPNRRGEEFWETKSSSSEEAPKVSTFYAFTPRTRLRTNLRDASPDKVAAQASAQTDSSHPKGTSANTSDRPLSPRHSGAFARSQTSRDPKDFTENLNSTSAHDRRKSSSSIGTDGIERRKFSYLFNEDSVRRPHRSVKHPQGSDHDGEDENFVKNRTTPVRQSYPSRRNTLDREGREGTPTKMQSESRSGIGPKNSERQRFGVNSHVKAEESRSTLNSFRSFDTNRSSPVSISGNSPDDDQRPKSFSMTDWNTVFSGEQNIFAVPKVKTQPSPRKGATIPKIQTNFSTGGVRLNFSRPRPASTTTEFSGTPNDTALDDNLSSGESYGQHGPRENADSTEAFPKNTFIFEDWKNAFANNNPFDVTISQQSSSGPAIRSASKYRKAATKKKSATLFQQNKTPAPSDEPHNIKDFTSSAQKVGDLDLDALGGTEPAPTMPKDITPIGNVPSPVAMDIDTPRRNPTPIPTIPITPVNPKYSTLNQSKIYHSPTVSDEEPVSPIKGEVPPISPLRSDELLQPDGSTNEPPQAERLYPEATMGDAEPSATIQSTKSFLDMGNIQNVEPISYPYSNGLSGHWQGLRDTLPFDSRPASFVNISPSSSPKNNISIPPPPEPPATPVGQSATSYDKCCAAMTVYQAQWNEYNAKIVNHMRARVDADIIQCAKNKGFASGTSNNPKMGVQLDLIQTRKTLTELDEDQEIRAHWQSAIKTHVNILTRWKIYLEHLDATDGFG
ncbi:hypothetical protein H072_2560 [Dactylellina haptotyla CBS 200.50]|uniref:J domain-containing protein n=1 Tax=Dactylellina haptotyla (strain CBS 200.50) TaxID=1284197 RepID=S8AKL1_DACHA|nr:hypothetical protein H072_2560 [Dactylellina haptotyla CBS 200.50]